MYHGAVRQLVLLTIVVAALIVVLWATSAPSTAVDPKELSYITTAHQLGVVGYRDPAGAISPDSRHLAYRKDVSFASCRSMAARRSRCRPLRARFAISRGPPTT